MSDPLIPEDDGATPLGAEEMEQLIPSYITLRAELNEAEQRNILEAETWAFRRERNVLSEGFLKDLHKRMYGNVWRWAGSFRLTEHNIGIEPYRIAVDLRQLLGDCQYWIENQTCHPDEIALRFSHRLVQIHPFPNGNGRHSRIAADLLLVKLGCKRFTWGRANLVNIDETRDQYITALRAADRHNYGLLKAFVRS